MTPSAPKLAWTLTSRRCLSARMGRRTLRGCCRRCAPCPRRPGPRCPSPWAGRSTSRRPSPRCVPARWSRWTRKNRRCACGAATTAATGPRRRWTSRTSRSTWRGWPLPRPPSKPPPLLPLLCQCPRRRPQPPPPAPPLRQLLLRWWRRRRRRWIRRSSSPRTASSCRCAAWKPRASRKTPASSAHSAPTTRRSTSSSSSCRPRLPNAPPTSCVPRCVRRKARGWCSTTRARTKPPPRT